MNERPLIQPEREEVLSLADETQFAPNGIVSRTLLRTPNLRVVLFGFAEGQELTEHTSTQRAVIEILSGECDFSLAGKSHQLKGGATRQLIESGLACAIGQDGSDDKPEFRKDEHHGNRIDTDRQRADRGVLRGGGYAVRIVVPMQEHES